jgi:hypothetical protein
MRYFQLDIKKMYIKIAPISMYISFFFAFIYGFHSLHIQPFIDLD